METCPITITRMHAGRLVEATDELAIEEPLQIQLLYGSSGKEQRSNLAVTMRTPGNDEELAAGFLFTEGIISDKSQLIQIISEASGQNTVLAILRGTHVPDLQSAERNFYVTSSCGVCGKSSINAVRRSIEYPSSHEAFQVSASLIYRLPDSLHAQQELFKSTGGLHACALFDNKGNLVSVREDVGRHNALDKLIGNAFLRQQLPLHNSILLLSGRASFELVQKAAVAGITVIAAIGAPSSLAVELANDAGITLIGFLKSDRFNIYSGPERIVE
jgi:FdhD protein